MITILNLTQTKATEQQKAAGVVDLDNEDFAELNRLFNVGRVLTQNEKINCSHRVVHMIGGDDVLETTTAVMIDRDSCMGEELGQVLIGYGLSVVYTTE